MKTSPQGREAITQREGLRLKAYRDSRGIATIGVGHAFGPPVVRMGQVITRERADAILSGDLGRFEAAVTGAVKVALTQNQFDACVSLAFNIGERGFAGSTVVHRLNQKDYKGAADAFLMWERPPELKSRRESERLQFLKGPMV